MDGHPDRLQRPQQTFQPVGQLQGGGGVGQQEGAGDQHQDAHHHKDGVDNALPGDVEDPEGHQRLAGGVEDVQQGGEHQDEHHRLHAPQQGLELDGGRRHHPRQHRQQDAVGHQPLGQEQGHDVAGHGGELGPGVQAVDGGFPREILAQGDISECHYTPSFRWRAASTASRAWGMV